MVDYKKAVQQAKKELEKEAIEEVKKYIKETLQGIEDVKASINQKQRELKALKADLDDLENGKLDKIKERQEKDKTAKKISKVDVDQLIKDSPILKPFMSGSTYWSGTNNVVDNTLKYTSTAGAVTVGFNLGDYKNAISGTYVVNSGGTEKAYYVQKR